MSSAFFQSIDNSFLGIRPLIVFINVFLHYLGLVDQALIHHGQRTISRGGRRPEDQSYKLCYDDARSHVQCRSPAMHIEEFVSAGNRWTKVRSRWMVFNVFLPTAMIDHDMQDDFDAYKGVNYTFFF